MINCNGECFKRKEKQVENVEFQQLKARTQKRNK